MAQGDDLDNVGAQQAFYTEQPNPSVLARRRSHPPKHYPAGALRRSLRGCLRFRNNWWRGLRAVEAVASTATG